MFVPGVKYSDGEAVPYVQDKCQSTKRAKLSEQAVKTTHTCKLHTNHEYDALRTDPRKHQCICSLTWYDMAGSK